VPGRVAEDDYPPDPPDLYSATKISCEYLGKHYASAFDFDFRLCRVFFCYGPGKIPSRFIKLYRMGFGALEGLRNLKMDRGADQKLDFTYIEDAARGVALLYQAKQPQYDVYNIATGIPSRLGKVAELSQKYSRFPVTVELGPGEIMRRCEALDISRAREDLGYAPRVGLEEGIRRYADWLEKVR
jgi:nucleoside-diphosphate-sugar epimerase